MKLMIGKLMITVVTGFLVFGYGEVWGADWKFIRMNKGGDSCYYDVASLIRPSEKIVRGSVKIVYSEKSVNREVERLGPSYKDLSHIIILWEMNCIEKKAAFLEITTYSKSEKIIKSNKVKTITWASIVPDTIGEDLYKLLCK